MGRKEVAAPRPYHAVQFYGSDERLFCAVGRFLAQALIDGQPALVIAIPSHREGILHQLGARLIDVDRARRDGDLVLLDSEEMLDLFMSNGVPDPAAFEQNVGRFIRQTLQGREGAALRAYGDMVNVLWQQREQEAALQLEGLWSTLAQRFGFSLLCGYAMDQFAEETSELHSICEQHTHVFGPEHASTFAKLTAH
jgi:hypothetical protein